MSSIEDPATDPSYFDEELVRVGAQIHQLIGLRTRLLSRCNQLRSPIYTLPFELLSAIFSYTCTSGMISSADESWEISTLFNPQAVVLSSVSSRWRKVAFQTAALWNRVVLNVSEDTVESKAGLFQHYLDRVKNFDVTVDLGLNNGPQMKNRALHYRPVADILFALENAQRIKTLRLRNPPVEWLAKLSQLPGVDTLHLGSLESENGTPIALDLRAQPLRRLSLFQTRWESVNLPPSLRALAVYGMPTDFVWALLRQCPNLVECRNWKPPSSGPITMPLALRHLETLTWSVFRGSPDIPVQDLHLPAIKHLHLIGLGNEQPTSVIAFCHQYSVTLTWLELESLRPWRADEVRRLLCHNMPHLEVLDLISWPLSRLVVAVRVLTPSNEEFARHEVKFLPRLRSLRLRADNSNDPRGEVARALEFIPSRSDDEAVCMLDLFLKMLKRRRAGRLSPFRLDLPALWDDDRKMIWSTKLQGMVRRTVKGRRIEVLQVGEVLEWLV